MLTVFIIPSYVGLDGIDPTKGYRANWPIGHSQFGFTERISTWNEAILATLCIALTPLKIYSSGF